MIYKSIRWSFAYCWTPMHLQLISTKYPENLFIPRNCMCRLLWRSHLRNYRLAECRQPSNTYARTNTHSATPDTPTRREMPTLRILWSICCTHFIHLSLSRRSRLSSEQQIIIYFCQCRWRMRALARPINIAREVLLSVVVCENGQTVFRHT